MSIERRTREEIDALGVPREKRRLLWEARAKLMWGSERREVERELEAAGVDVQTVAAFMAICLRERAVEMRGKGLLDLMVGTTLVAVGVIGGVLISSLHDALRQRVDGGTKAAGVLWAVCLLAGIYGGFRLVRGIERVVFGSRADGAVSDLDE
jgi:hypothetical protein